MECQSIGKNVKASTMCCYWSKEKKNINNSERVTSASMYYWNATNCHESAFNLPNTNPYVLVCLFAPTDEFCFFKNNIYHYSQYRRVEKIRFILRVGVYLHTQSQNSKMKFQKKKSQRELFKPYTYICTHTHKQPNHKWNEMKQAETFSIFIKKLLYVAYTHTST